IGRASCRERVEISVVALSLKKKNRSGGTHQIKEGTRSTGSSSPKETTQCMGCPATKEMPEVIRTAQEGVTRLFFFSSRRRHTRLVSDWSSDVCSSDLCARLRASRRPPACGRRSE